MSDIHRTFVWDVELGLGVKIIRVRVNIVRRPCSIFCVRRLKFVIFTLHYISLGLSLKIIVYANSDLRNIHRWSYSTGRPYSTGGQQLVYFLKPLWVWEVSYSKHCFSFAISSTSWFPPSRCRHLSRASSPSRNDKICVVKR